MIGQLNPATMPASLASGTRSQHVGGQNGVDGSGTMAEGAPARTEQAPA
jgi:hypothetical protein